MALRSITVPRFVRKHHVLLNSPTQEEEWNAWKHHYCALTWPTVNGWVKVPFEMHDIKTKNTQTRNLAYVLCYTGWVKVNVKTVELSSNICVWCPLSYIANFSHTRHNKPALHARIKHTSNDILCYEHKPKKKVFSFYKNTLHFDTWIQNSKKDKLL